MDQLGVDTPLIAMRSIRMQTILARATGNQFGSEVRCLQEQVFRLRSDPTTLATHDARHRQWLLVVSDEQCAGI